MGTLSLSRINLSGNSVAIPSWSATALAPARLQPGVPSSLFWTSPMNELASATAGPLTHLPLSISIWATLQTSLHHSGSIPADPPNHNLFPIAKQNSICRLRRADSSFIRAVAVYACVAKVCCTAGRGRCKALQRAMMRSTLPKGRSSAGRGTGLAWHPLP